MKKAQTLTIAASLSLGFAGGSYMDNIDAKNVDQRVNVQKVLPAEEAEVILGVVVRQACPEINESHGAECDLMASLQKVCFDLFRGDGPTGMRMHSRFRLPGRFKAE